MTVNIENGQGIIDILSDGIVTCLKVRKPVAADWYDGAGSAGKYFALTADYEHVAKDFNEVLLTNDETAIHSAMHYFLLLFGSGSYSVSITQNTSTEYELHCEYALQNYPAAYAYGYYNPSDENVMFTQPMSQVNNLRVKEYEEMILGGARPKAVLFQSFFVDRGEYEDGSKWMRSTDSPMFVLDGHHKLLAYKNLNIDPHYVLITKERTGKEEFGKNKRTLFFDYEYFLTEPHKLHVISHNPGIFTDGSPRSNYYNVFLDRYLEGTSSVQVEVLKCFQEAFLTGKQPELKWLLARLEVLERCCLQTPQLHLNYFERTEKYPQGIWNIMPIQSRKDFNDWTIKLLGEDIDGIRKKIIEQYND